MRRDMLALFFFFLIGSTETCFFFFGSILGTEIWFFFGRGALGLLLTLLSFSLLVEISLFFFSVGKSLSLELVQIGACSCTVQALSLAQYWHRPSAILSCSDPVQNP